MIKSNSRKVYAAVLGVAVAGFIADRAFLGGGFGPEAASAAEAAPLAVAAPAPRESKARLSERVAAAFEKAAVESAALTGETPDLFDPTAAFGAPTAGQSAEKTHQALEQEFLRTHKLTALSDNLVVINGRTLKLDPPAEISGYRITGTYREEENATDGNGNEVKVGVTLGVTLAKDGVTIRLPLNPAQTAQTTR